MSEQVERNGELYAECIIPITETFKGTETEINSIVSVLSSLEKADYEISAKYQGTRELNEIDYEELYDNDDEDTVKEGIVIEVSASFSEMVEYVPAFSGASDEPPHRAYIEACDEDEIINEFKEMIEAAVKDMNLSPIVEIDEANSCIDSEECLVDKVEDARNSYYEDYCERD